MDTNHEASQSDIDLARSIETGFWAAVVGIAVFGGFFMQERACAWTMLVLPWGAILLVALSGDRFTLRMYDRHAGEVARSSVLSLVLVPALFLIHGGYLGYTLVRDPGRVAHYAIFGGIVMTVLAIFSSADLRWRWPAIGTMVLVAGAYSYGAIEAANAIYDSRVIGTEVAVIVGKRTDAVERPVYILLLQSTDVAKVSVPSDLYDRKNLGDTMCIYSYAGSLHMPWRRVTECE